MKYIALLLLLMVACTAPAPKNADSTPAVIPPSMQAQGEFTQQPTNNMPEQSQNNVQEEIKEETQQPTQEETIIEKRLTIKEVALHDSEQDCWTIVDNMVYDLTTWIRLHPGGSFAITNMCGIDATVAFEQQHARSTKANNQLATFLLGPLE